MANTLNDRFRLFMGPRMAAINTAIQIPSILRTGGAANPSESTKREENINHKDISTRGSLSKYGRFVPALMFYVFTFFLAGGCQEQGVVGTLPGANFNGPAVQAPPPPVAPQIVKAPVKAPVLEIKKPAVMAGIPREWIPAATKADGWKWIVIHHSATPTGGAVAFDRMHKQKGWDELGYHFVIGNGTDTRDGQVEVGPRWPKQKHGAHAKTPDNQFNEFGIGICLVGNFDTQNPSRAQQQALAKLVAYMMKTYHIPADRVIGHGDTKATDCPGKNVHIAQIRQMAVQILASEGTQPETVAKRPSGEMMVDLPRR